MTILGLVLFVIVVTIVVCTWIDKARENRDDIRAGQWTTDHWRTGLHRAEHYAGRHRHEHLGDVTRQAALTHKGDLS